MIVGYARVSTLEQDLSGQLVELRSAGCAKVYSEKASGTRGDRAELQKVIGRLEPVPGKEDRVQKGNEVKTQIRGS